MSEPVKRLKLEELELWKRKATALDEAVRRYQNCIQTEDAMKIMTILLAACDPDSTNARILTERTSGEGLTADVKGDRE